MIRRVLTIMVLLGAAWHQGVLARAAENDQGCVPHALGVSCTNDGPCSNITDEVCSDICIANGFSGGLHAYTLCVDGPDGSFECPCYGRLD